MNINTDDFVADVLYGCVRNFGSYAFQFPKMLTLLSFANLVYEGLFKHVSQFKNRKHLPHVFLCRI